MPLCACHRATDRPIRFGVVEEPTPTGGGIYRGGQPTPEEVAALGSDLGVRTILKLDVQNLDEERAAARAAKIRLIEIPLDPYRVGSGDRATTDAAERALRVLTAPENAPVYVHCRRGSDRAGYIVALHRARDQGWSFERISDELARYGHGRLARLRLPAITRALEREAAASRPPAAGRRSGA